MFIKEMVAEKHRCEQSMWAARAAANNLENAVDEAIAAPAEQYDEAENKMLNAIGASVAIRLAAALNARILRERALEASTAITDGRIALTDAAKATFVAVNAAISAGFAEAEARRCGRAEVRAHEVSRKGAAK